MWEPIITAGTLILVAVISTIGAITVARINTVGKKVETTITQTAATGNGFAQHMKDQIQEIVDRLDAQDRARATRDAHMNMLLARYDDRLINIEEKL